MALPAQLAPLWQPSLEMSVILLAPLWLLLELSLPLPLWWGPLSQPLQPTSMALREPLVMLALVLMQLEQ